ncbi:acyl-CoA thioesterase [Moraxella canis]|uniref:acyl-CoA thioesterase n=1 Tax=Moraxella canis TaxID=90239 RepID=UPI0006690856|nr:acyl-CoA thioesterase II [Moraxella canis]
MKYSLDRYALPPEAAHADIADLLNTLKLKEIADNVYEGPSYDYVGPRVFGGQVLAQALMAAAKTMTIDKPCHSLHGYFLRGGDIRLPIVYQVRRLRDGRSLSAREVIAVQYVPTTDKDGKDTTSEQVIFSMIASFSPMEGGLDYQESMPEYPPPTSVKTEQELKTQYLHKIPEPLRARYMRPRHVEIRPIMPRDPVAPEPQRPRQASWVRVNDIGEQPVAIHQALLAFVSDYYLAGTGLMSHGLSFMTRGLQMASIDHSMHFHRPFDITEYLLYDMWSDTTSHAKGLNHGQFWQDGKLIASAQQEGLMRLHDDPSIFTNS